MTEKQEKHDKMSEIDEHISKRFDIKKRLGKGAYGIVWRAVDRKSGETVAVKKIFDAFRNQTDSQRTFREIMFLQAFRNHPNIIHLHSIHRAANNRDIYLGFEYMDTDLHIVIKRGDILKDCHRRYIMYQLLNATHYIHSGNVIHRDQKPSNVLLNQHCLCKIADFGLARSLTPVSNTNSSLTTDLDPTLTDYVATRWYRAPEILIASKRYTKGIDMWSIGCILAEMLVGKPIFPGTSTVNQVEKIMSSIPPPSIDDISTVCSGIGTSMIKHSQNGPKTTIQSILGKDCPEDALDLVNKLLVFNPNKRLTATQALGHRYVEAYRSKEHEKTLHRNVIPPLNDDIRLSVDDYRKKLYEIMSHQSFFSKHSSKVSVTKKNLLVKAESRKPAEKLLRSADPPVKIAEKSRLIQTQQPVVPKEKSFAIRSESQFRYMESSSPPLTLKKGKANSEAKMPALPTRSSVVFARNPNLQRCQQHRNSIVEFKTEEKKLLALSKDNKTKRQFIALKRTSYNTPFNSYNQNHGIITASALRELKQPVR